MAALDWSQCPAVESVPGKVSGAWVLKDTRMPVSRPPLESLYLGVDGGQTSTTAAPCTHAP